MELTIHHDTTSTIHIDWFDHNNIHLRDTIEIKTRRDKPRTLGIHINGTLVQIIDGSNLNDRSSVNEYYWEAKP